VSLTFETIGNATIQFLADGSPILATDPWLVGTCYFGSWALDHALTEREIRNVVNSDYLWISHGHPDHLHHESLALLPKGKRILLPDHYHDEIRRFLADQGFEVEILPYRTWRRLHPQLEVLCLDNENQDAILIARFGDALVINLNDSPLYGEGPFIRRLIRRHPNDRAFVLQLCSIDADMKNFVDGRGVRTLEPPEVLKPGAIWSVARGVEWLGARYFCCSSSQHLYVRSDSVWANPYRITYDDIRRHWNRPGVTVVPPFVTMDVGTGTYVENYPSRRPDYSQITDRPGEDDWTETLSAREWRDVEEFVRRYKLLGRFIDFVEIEVGGEYRRFATSSEKAARRADADGIRFIVPRRSLLETVKYGYFDDLLIGNFMKTHLHGRAELYPFITPVIAKLGGNAKVYDRAQYVLFLWRYLRRNPFAFVTWRIERAFQFGFLPWTRRWATRLGMFEVLKRAYRNWLLKDAVALGPQVSAADLLDRPSGSPSRPAIGLSLPAKGRTKQTPLRPDFSYYDRPRLIVSIDAEEDFDWSGGFSSQSKSVESMSRQHLAQDIMERHGVRPIYLCDFPVADQEAAYAILRDWYRAGRCVIGTQLHPWVNPPHVETVNQHNSYPCNLPFELQQEKLKALTERIAETIGVRPTVYKAGRYGAGPELPMLLKPLGYRIDMSINPIRDYRAQGGPDHMAYPHTPFWFDAERELLEIPLTGNVLGAMRRHWVELAEIVWGPSGERFKLAPILRHLKLINRVSLTPEGIPLHEAKALTRLLLASGHRVFSLCYHSTSLNPGSTPYVRTEADLRRFLRWFDDYLSFFLGELGGISIIPDELYRDARTAPVTQEPLA